METATSAPERLSVQSADDLVFGTCPHPVTCGRGGLVIGGGTVYPEVNFTLPPMEIAEATWPQVIEQYRHMVDQTLERAVALEVPGLVIEFEHLPPMTERPEWGAEITALLRGAMDRAHAAHGLPCALRVTPVDLRDGTRPPRLRTGDELGLILESFRQCARAGADILAIESVGGKEINDPAMAEADLMSVVAGTAVLGVRDMEFLWERIVAIAVEEGCVAGGDTACGFANTAMVMADQGMIPAVFAAVVRALGAARIAVAHLVGAVGPTKDCAYEGPVIKALFGVPIAMEGKAAACAHMSHCGNVASAAADLWSNESVQNVRLLAGHAPEIFTEILAYDCRLMNLAARRGEAKRLRDWMVESDAVLSPHAFIITPEASVALAQAWLHGECAHTRAVAVARCALDLMRAGHSAGRLQLSAREVPWLDRMQMQLDAAPATEAELVEAISPMRSHLFLPTEYGL